MASQLQDTSISPSTSLSLPLSSTTTTPTSPLLALPAEIRNQIYALLLTSTYIPALRQISTRGHVSDYILPSLNLCPMVLSTCRQIYAEAHSILYGTNTFAAHPSLLASLPYLISPRRPVLTGPGLQKIRKWYINVRLDVDPKFDAEQATKAFSGAEELEVDVFQAMYGSCDFSVLRLFDQVRGVGKATVSCSTGCEDYARWLEAAMMMPLGTDVVPYTDDHVWELWSTK